MDIQDSVNILKAHQNVMSLEAFANGGRFQIKAAANRIPFELLVSLNAALALGGAGLDGLVSLNNAAGKTTIVVNGSDGEIILNDDSGKQSVRLSGQLGDIILKGADAAEDFEIAEGDARVPAGSVMVIDCGGKLRRCFKAYDRRVAGIVSGSGTYKPGIVLGRSQVSGHRRPIALAGKVYCRAEATLEPIGVGDLLTSSAIPGHAMKASDQRRAFGAILGKSLQSLPAGQALIPVLVALQ
jgi:hypothetical protein